MYVCMYVCVVSFGVVLYFLLPVHVLSNLLVFTVTVLQGTAYMENFVGLIFRGSLVRKGFCRLIFTDHQVEYITSLSHCFFMRIKISC